MASSRETNPTRAHAYLAAGANGDTPRLAALYRELCGMRDALLGIVGTTLVDGAYDKLLHRMAEPDFPLRLLPPYVSSTEAMADVYRSTLAARLPDWLPSR